MSVVDLVHTSLSLQQQLCKDGVGQHSYLELLQCLDVLPDQVTSWDICYPSRDALQNQINQVLETHSDIKHVYIATDDIVAFDKLQLKFDDQVCKMGLISKNRASF